MHNTTHPQAFEMVPSRFRARCPIAPSILSFLSGNALPYPRIGTATPQNKGLLMTAPPALLDALDAYGLTPGSLTPAGGTAGRTWRVEAAGASYFARQRGVRTSSPQRIAFDHGLRAHLASSGYPTVAPLDTADGDTWVSTPDGVFELYPFVEGRPFSLDALPRIRTTTARALARLHKLAQSYQGFCEERVPQYTSYPVSIAPRHRFDHPDAQLEAVDYIIGQHATGENRLDLEAARERVIWVGAQYERLYHGLERGVTHGDYNCFNLLFSPSGDVAGVFDFDWAWREVRLLDIAQGMFFFGTQRDGDLDPGSIWSLTRCPRFDLDTMLEFVRAYHTVAPLTDAEVATLPIAMLTRWVSWRIEGVMKVPPERRAEFFLYGFQEPFTWHEHTTWPPRV